MASEVLTMAASAISRFATASRGPLTSSCTPNLYHSQAGIKGMMNPAPRPIMLLQPENLSTTPKFFPLSILRPGLMISL